MANNLLIVDDEPEIVDWLYELLSENKDLDIEVFKAYTSRDALVCLESIKIDVVLSDIRMPGITGLQLLDRIKKDWPHCRVIFLTGFRDFDYIYTAIQKDGVSYLLKTEGDDKILDTVKQTFYEIEEGLKDEEIQSKALEQMNKALPLLQREYLVEILEGFIGKDDIIQERLDELEIPIQADQPLFMFISYLDNLSAQIPLTKTNNYLYSLKTIGEQQMLSGCKYICFKTGQANLLWLVQPENKELEGISGNNEKLFYERFLVSLQGTFEYVQNICRKSLNTTVSIGFCDGPLYIEEIADRYNQLKRLVGYRAGLGKELILNSMSFQHADQGNAAEEDADVMKAVKQLNRLKELENYLESGRKEECNNLLNSLLECLRRIESRNYNPALEIYYNVSVVLLRYINRWNLNKKTESKVELHKLMRSDEHASWDNAVDYLIEIVQVLFEIQSDDEEKKTADTITRLQQYIHSHLSEDLSLSKLAEVVRLNPSYLSRLFKQATAMNVSEYILEMRIDRARVLLRENVKKINEISEEVGYNSSHSFARFFRNTVGVSPQEYRDQFLNK